MKIAKKDLALIMVVVGILVAFCAYKFVFTGKLEDVDKEKQKQEGIQVQIDKVKKQAGNEPKMKAEIQSWEKELASMIEKFKVVSAKYEDGILYFNKLENDLDVPVKSFTVAETKEAASVVGAGNFNGKTYTKGTTNYSFSYEVADYDALKKFINYLVSGESGVKKIENISFSVGPVAISGNVSLSVYVMSDGTVKYEPPVIDGVNTGKLENIFQQSGKEE